MRRAAQAVPVLMYHHVSPAPGLVTVSPESFRRQMAHLAHAGYTPLTADQFLGFLEGSYAAPRKSVLITFDDGYLDNYAFAFPVLKAFGLRATIFAVTGWLGDGPVRRDRLETEKGWPDCPNHRACMEAVAGAQADRVMLRWSEVEAMQGVVEVHSHTHTHTRWDKVHADERQRDAALAQDLADSRETLRARLGYASAHLCWPQGYFDARYQAIARATGYRALYTTDKHVNTGSTAPEDVGRIVIKDRRDAWFARRMWLYSHARWGRIYTALRGK
ncbi:MAG: polysaccharide deacetylase family protein [Betaproteobacteria bacterium]|nr:polysaccharide deacetylase family protein [Betaproteobacteria bacterium]